MKVIGRIGDIVYLNFSAPRIIVGAKLQDNEALEYIDEYSSLYFIDLAVYGESMCEESEPITEADYVATANRLINKFIRPETFDAQPIVKADEVGVDVYYKIQGKYCSDNFIPFYAMPACEHDGIVESLGDMLLGKHNTEEAYNIASTTHICKCPVCGEDWSDYTDDLEIEESSHLDLIDNLNLDDDWSTLGDNVEPNSTHEG